MAAPSTASSSAGARHPGKGYDLVCRSQRCDFDEVFGLVMANQADFPCALCAVF